MKKRTRPGVDWIREGGVWFDNAWCFTPSYSLPGFAAIGTGARPCIAGVTSNWQKLHGDIGVDNIFKIVKERDETTAVAGSPEWMNLYGKWIIVNKTIEGEMFNMDSIIGDYAVSIIRQHKPKLLLVHLYDVDRAGHKYGALSDEYRRQMKEADVEIGKIINALSEVGIINETLLIVTSDHGFTDKFHHGGWEEDALHILLVMRGPGVKRMEIDEEVFQDQIVATVCFFLGYRLPTGLTGDVLFDAFEVDEKRKAAYQISLAEIKFEQFRWFAEQFGLREAYEEKILMLSGSLTSVKKLFLDGNYSEALNKAEKLEEDCEDFITKVRNERHSKEVSLRQRTVILIYAATLTPLAITVFIFRRRINWRIPLAAITCTVGYLAGFWTAFFVNGWYFSVSVFQAVKDFESGTMQFTIIGLIVAGIIIGLTSDWILRKENRRIKTVLAALIGLILVAVVNLIYASIYYVKWNYVLDWYFPEGLSWGDAFVYYLMLVQNTFMSLLFAITSVIALITSLIVSKVYARGKS